MKKLFGFIFGLIVIAAIMAGIGVGAYYWSGSLAKDSFEKSIMQTTGNQAITYKLNSFEQGLFISKAIAELTLDPGKFNSGVNTQVIPTDKMFSIQLEHTIYHGPFAFKAPEFDPAQPVAAFIKTRINTDSNPELKEVLNKLWKTNPFKMNSMVSFAGVVETTIEVAPIDFTSPDNMHIKWSGAKSIIAHNTATNSFDSAIDAGGVSIEDDDNFALVDGIAGTASGSFDAGNFMNSKAAYSIDNIQIEANTKNESKALKGTMNNLAVKAGNEINGNQLSSYMELSVDDAMFNDENYGPGNFQINLRKIDADAIKQLQNDLEMAKEDAAKQGLPPEAAMFIAQQKLMETLPKLLQQGPEIEISKLDFSTPQGKVEGYTKISLDLGGKPVPANPMELIPMVAINTSFSAPSDLIEKILASDAKKEIARDLSMTGEQATPEQLEELAMNKVKSQLEALTAQNAISRDGTKIVGSYRLNNGKLNLNGMEIPLEQMIGSLMQGQAPK